MARVPLPEGAFGASESADAITIFAAVPVAEVVTAGARAPLPEGALGASVPTDAALELAADRASFLEWELADGDGNEPEETQSD